MDLGSNGGCETLNLQGDRCVEILRSDCRYEFYSGDQCRGNIISPNRGDFVGSVMVKTCHPSALSSDDNGFRLGWRGKKKNGKFWPFPHHINSIQKEHRKNHHHDKEESLWYWNR